MEGSSIVSRGRADLRKQFKMRTDELMALLAAVAREKAARDMRVDIDREECGMDSLCQGALVSTENRLLVNLYLMKALRPIAAKVRGCSVATKENLGNRHKKLQKDCPRSLHSTRS